ncbi:MAG: hypothetical protein CMJ76_13475 [Planctomycetaceae bacterium]|nr:hypothetical protein [Planctomycetaceae bacterium]|tara:strand:- start:417 stop:1331 length:915 start_codon:yes stop_codon:yes gene_type:complete
MGVAATTQSVIIHMNTLSRAITYQGVVKFIDDKYWETEIVPELFPMWHSDRDKLEVFTAFKDDHYQVTRNKYVRNPKDKTGKWTSYEFPVAELDPAEAKGLKDTLIEKYIDYKETVDRSIEQALQNEYVHKNELSWEKCKLMRNFLLHDSDYVMMPDSPVTDGDEKALWEKYRQHLRDIPANPSFATAYDVKFPITPKEYLAREAAEALPQPIVDKHGDFGKGSSYMESEYHFWKPTESTLQKWRQRMAFYMLLRLDTLDDSLTISNLLSHRASRSNEDLLEPNHPDKDAYINELLRQIESGEV